MVPVRYTLHKKGAQFSLSVDVVFAARQVGIYNIMYG